MCNMQSILRDETGDSTCCCIYFPANQLSPETKRNSRKKDSLKKGYDKVKKIYKRNESEKIKSKSRISSNQTFYE